MKKDVKKNDVKKFEDFSVNESIADIRIYEEMAIYLSDKVEKLLDHNEDFKVKIIIADKEFDLGINADLNENLEKLINEMIESDPDHDISKIIKNKSVDFNL